MCVHHKHCRENNAKLCTEKEMKKHGYVCEDHFCEDICRKNMLLLPLLVAELLLTSVMQN